MQTITGIVLAVCFVGAVAVETLAPAHAQYSYGYPTWNGCPPGWTVQGGNCAPYRGHGGGFSTDARPVTRYKVEISLRRPRWPRTMELLSRCLACLGV